MAQFSKRVGAVVAGTAVLAVIGTTGATAAKMIGSADIKNDSVRSIDIKNDTLRLADIHPNAIKNLKGNAGKRGPAGPAGAKGEDAVVAPYVATLDDATTIEAIGGKIGDRATQLDDLDLKLEPGTYLVTLDGAFMSDEAAADPAIEVYPQLSLYQDLNNNNQLEWNADPALNEGEISPNAIMPAAKDRHISASGTTVITVVEATTLSVAAFGYTSTEGSQRSGEIDVINATLTATPINAG